MANVTRQRMVAWLVVALGGVASTLVPVSSARADCCLDACPIPSIIACTSVGCPTDVVPNCPGQIVAESPGPGATCGAGLFTTCPNNEYGQCTDGVNNDAWIDALADCADPDCFNDPACCGGPGQRCCENAPCIAPIVGECDDPNLVCAPAGAPDKMCVACGGLGDPCCLLEQNGSVESSCSEGLVCEGQGAVVNGTCISLAAVAPALSPTALAAGSLLLLLLGAWHLRRHRID